MVSVCVSRSDMLCTGGYKLKKMCRVWEGIISFLKYYEKVGVISWIMFPNDSKNKICSAVYWNFDLQSGFVDFFTRFTHEKTS